MTIIFLSWRASRLPNLAAFLDGDPRYFPLFPFCRWRAFAGWGRGRKSRAAQWLAALSRIPFLTIEDGFLRSVERDDLPLSLIIDDLGVYYDANQPSRLETLVAQPLDEGQTERARALVEAWRQARVSKYNQHREYGAGLPGDYVLVVDQTFGDASVEYGRADAQAFERMLEAALSENPDSTIVIKTHPDFLTRKKRGYFDKSALKKSKRIVLMGEDCSPVRFIEKAEVIYTVTSQMGFEALIWGKRVRSFGMPFYAGWGLTEDDLPAPERRGKASLEQLVHAALVDYPRYVDPETGERCEVESTLSHVALQRRMRARFVRDVHAIGFSRWKRPILQRFLTGSRVCFSRAARDVPAGAAVAVWGRRQPAGLPDDARLIRIEDGFLRSVGLGACLTQPVSWVCDDKGIYYDASRPSRLESILLETIYDEPLLARAWSLRQAILGAGLTKYNVGTGTSASYWQRPETDRRVILVTGQVEDDASIRFGTPGIATNLGLLRAVRHDNSRAYIVYKPHPDVVAGLRSRGEGESNVARFCDEIVLDADMAQLLAEVDEVHTMTSLAGFEALMRGKRVTCYGQPFYAGWGLTTDIVPIARCIRRRLTLDELVAGSLILYPTYVSRVTNRFTTPERAVEELIDWRETGAGQFPMWRKVLRPFFRLASG